MPTNTPKVRFNVDEPCYINRQTFACRGAPGIEFDEKTGVVKYTIEGFPADRAGVRTGWKFLKINEKQYTAKAYYNALKSEYTIEFDTTGEAEVPERLKLSRWGQKIPESVTNATTATTANTTMQS